MHKFYFEATKLAGLSLIHPFYTEDSRGQFIKSFEHTVFAEAGIHLVPAEEFFSSSRRGTIRGLHFQRRHCQDKLIRVLNGAAFDVAVDLRAGSPTFGQWERFLLTAENRHMVYIPKGYAHGFLALENNTLLSYLCGDRFDPETDGGIRWDDPELGIDWPLRQVGEVTVSEKDQILPTFSTFRKTHGHL